MERKTENNHNGVAASEKKSSPFFRFQLTAFIATIVDFLITILVKELTSLHYSWAVAIGAACGAITAFSINRYLVFQSLQTHPAQQAIRYLLVVIGSIVLNTFGTYLVTENFHSQYLISKAIIAILVGFTYSYHFSKRFVFYV